MNFKDAKTLGGLKKITSRCHWEIIRNDKASHAYVMKEETRVAGPWEFGVKPLRRNNKTDWEEVKANAQTGNFQAIPADIFVRHYNNLKQIAKDSIKSV